MQLDHTPYGDAVLVSHAGLLLVQHTSDSQTWVLPARAGLSGAKLVATLRERMNTTVESAGTVPVNGTTVERIVIPSMAMPDIRGNQRWVSPEEVTELPWAPGWESVPADLMDLLLMGQPIQPESGSGTTRIGGTIRRRTGPWTPAVHAGLQHLQNFGLDATPAVLGFDQLNREKLSYLPGRLVAAGQMLNEVQLAEVASWTLRLHEALRGFSHNGPFRGETPEGATMFGHNYLDQRNLCFAGNRLVGVVGWDFLGPSTAPLELAWLVWSTAPLGGVTKPDIAARRVCIVAQTYDIDPFAILDAVQPRVELFVESLQTAAAAGDQGAHVTLVSPDFQHITDRLKHYVDTEHQAVAAAL